MGFLFQNSSAQQVLTTVTKTKTAWNNSGDTLHRIANQFADEVGDQLKAYYPARAENISVILMWNQATGYTLNYSADIVRDTFNYQLIFDHRGSLSYGNYYDARANAKQRCKQQVIEAVPKFQVASRDGHVTLWQGYTSSARTDNAYAFLCEAFIATK